MTYEVIIKDDFFSLKIILICSCSFELFGYY